MDYGSANVDVFLVVVMMVFMMTMVLVLVHNLFSTQCLFVIFHDLLLLVVMAVFVR